MWHLTQTPWGIPRASALGMIKSSAAKRIHKFSEYFCGKEINAMILEVVNSNICMETAWNIIILG
jgi:hypothetical protein